MSKKYPMRSSQLISPYGVGALVVQRGTSFVVCGLDSMFPAATDSFRWREAAGGSTGGQGKISQPDGGEAATETLYGSPEDARRQLTADQSAARPGAITAENIDEQEFVIREHRLEARLEVDSFRRPPDYREPRRGVVIPNAGLTISVLRFPQWTFCNNCRMMEFLPLTQKGRVYCRSCSGRENISELAQMPFVAICERGHMQDFPWREWVHREHRPKCRGELSYLRSGGGTLSSQKIKCIGCNAVRSLHRIDQAHFSDTYLSFNLSKKNGLFMCPGHLPWLGMTNGTKCESYVRGNLRGAGNLWFPQTVSAIYLPENSEQRLAGLRDFLVRADVAVRISSIEKLGGAAASQLAEMLRIIYPAALESYTEQELATALNACRREKHVSGVGPSFIRAKVERSRPLPQGAVSAPPPAADAAPKTPGVQPSEEAAFRYPEYCMLREDQNDELLLARRISVASGAPLFSDSFARLGQIHRLRDTRVFTGFSRIFSDNVLPLAERKEMLRRATPLSGNIALGKQGDLISESAAGDNWLPAISVYGEGIFLELNMKKFNAWTERQKSALRNHLQPLQAASRKIRNPPLLSPLAGEDGDFPGGSEKSNPLFILLHTLAHLLITELTFECGYSAAALRERIYASEHQATLMAGILIYTADGDSEGTLGGLVRMGTPQTLERLLQRAFASARWCASDPGCSEVGMSQGQGPDSCNLAACHSCALLPETSCENYNRYLDRSLLVNLPGSKIEGFFESV